MGLDWQNNSFARASRFFVHFLAGVARLQRESVSFHVLSRTGTQDNEFLFLFLNFHTYSLLEVNSRKSCQRLRLTERDGLKRETVWSTANLLFKWRFRGRRRRCCLSSLISVGRRRALKNLWLLFAEKATMWLCIWLGTSLVWVGEVKSNMDWSGCIVRLYMLTSDLTSLGSSQFSYRLQVRKLFRRLL